MDLGLSLGYLTGPVGPAAARALDLTRAAEDAGFASAWVAEAYGTDAVSVLGWLAARTSRIGLGSAVLQIPARAAASTAMTAATLDGLSGGRFRLGLGVSGPQVAEGWYGQPFAKPLARTREYVEVVRRLLAREESRFTGAHLELPLPGGPGVPLKLMQPAPRPDLPIHLAAVGPRNVELAGEIADGWLPSFLVPENSAESFDRLRAGFARRTRPVGGFAVTASVPFVLTGATGDERARAERPVRELIALYVGGMGSREQNFYADLGRRLGFGDAVDAVQDLYLAGRKDEAVQRVPAGLVEATSLVGSVDAVRRRLADHERAGVTTVALVPLGADPAGDLRAVA
ncbi:LLM class F420-dependent oxidoreductase [Kineococcus sp. SYSU DK001]|uniref:LLM class F420-dependent oxidoreductase n=1 Tax=Kineococcus sp. SYSU DK001 TaxID=3383122 RepID=UPI003D7D0440